MQGLRYAHIWEFDLDGCFNKLNHSTMGIILRSIGLPSWLWMGILIMQKKAPQGLKVASTTQYGTRTLVVDRGKDKEFMYLDGENTRGVAQGHSLSPLISVIMMEHAVQSYLARMRRAGKVLKILMYADDGIVFSTDPIDWMDIGRFFAKWGMYVSIPKSHMVREGWV